MSAIGKLKEAIDKKIVGKSPKGKFRVGKLKKSKYISKSPSTTAVIKVQKLTPDTDKMVPFMKNNVQEDKKNYYFKF